MGISEADARIARSYGSHYATPTRMDVEDFLESGYAAAEIELGEANPRVVYVRYASFISRNHVEGVKVVQRGEHVYLVRRDA